MMSPEREQMPRRILLFSLPRSRPFSSRAFSTSIRASYLQGAHHNSASRRLPALRRKVGFGLSK